MRTILVILMLLVSTCASSWEAEEKTQFRDKLVNDAFIDELSTNNIPYRIDNDGAVWHPYEKRLQVQEITRKIVRQYHPGNAVSSTDPDFLTLLISKFSENQIPYRTIQLSNETKIAWDSSVDKKARKTVKEVQEYFSKKRFEEFVNERKRKKNAL